MKKNKAYDLTATYREYKYFFARTEDFLTDNFNFNQKTQRGTLALTLFPRDGFNVGYNRVQKDGTSLVPRPFTPTRAGPGRGL